MWNRWTNEYVTGFLDRFDVMFESKHKNVATLDYYNQYMT